MLLIGLVVFLTPLLASADETKLACDCIEHDHKDSLLFIMGQPLHKEQKQCPSIPTIFYIDDEAMKFYNNLLESYPMSMLAEPVRMRMRQLKNTEES